MSPRKSREKSPEAPSDVEDFIENPDASAAPEDDQDDDAPGASRRHPLLKGVLRCTHVGLDDSQEDRLTTVIKFKQSKHEPDAKLSLTIRADGEGLSRIFGPSKQFGMELRTAPTNPDGTTANLRLDGEHLSLLVVCAHRGEALPTKKDGDRLSVLGFNLYNSDDVDVSSGGDVYRTNVLARIEGTWLNDRFELGDVYRLAITAPPEWVTKLDEPKAPETFEDTPLGQAIAEEEAKQNATTPISTSQLEGGEATVVNRDGVWHYVDADTERPLSDEEVDTLRQVMPHLFEGEE